MTAQQDTTDFIPNPRTALLLGIIPGGGQLYNRKWAKAALIMALDTYAISEFQQSRRLYNEYAGSPEADNPYLDQRNRHAWRVLFFYLLGIVDAYVDAHLSTFPEDTTTGDEQPSPDSIDRLDEEN